MYYEKTNLYQKFEKRMFLAEKLLICMDVAMSYVKK